MSDRPGTRIRVHPANALSAALVACTAVACALTAFWPRVLRGTPVMNGSARGTALVLLVMALPTLVLAMHASRRPSSRGVVVWLGALFCLAYNGVLLVFATPFNHLFLLYEAVLGLSLAAILTLLTQVDAPGLRDRLSPAMPRRGIAVYLWVIAGLNTLLWLRAVVPGMLSAHTPTFLAGTGLTTNPVYVQDLAFWLPFAGVAAFWLWRGTARGHLLAGAVLVFWVIEGVVVATDQWMGHAADRASTVASAAATPLFGALAAIGLVPLYLFFRTRAPATARAGQPGQPRSGRSRGRMAPNASRPRVASRSLGNPSR